MQEASNLEAGNLSAPSSTLSSLESWERGRGAGRVDGEVWGC